MRHAEEEDATLEEVLSSRGQPSNHQDLHIVFECDRPLAGSTRHCLHGVDQVLIGRGPERRFTRSLISGVPCLTLEVPDSRMSSRHAKLVRRGGRWVFEDTGSRNGSYLQGRRVMNASLGDGVALECGHTHFIFRWLNLVHTHVDGPPDVAASVSGEAALATLSHEREADLARLVDAARAGTSTLLIGEAGSGKDTLARAIHNAAGQRADFVAVRCRLLGREADARPGSVAAKLMRDFERAAGGTLFLDEIEELTPVAQLALLPLLQSARRASLASIVSSVRSNEPKPAVPSMPADLLADLAGFALRVAPLRERREDLGTLVAQILASATDSASSMVLEPRMGQSMLFHDWPYNLSELDRCVRGAVSTATSSTLRWSPATLFSVRSPASSGRTETVAPARAVPQDEIGSEPDPEFVANVRRALKCNLSPSGLRNNGLVGSYMVLEATGESSAPTLTVPALRNIVLSAIESLRQSSPRGERQSRVLDLTFIRPAPTQQEAADQLAMAFGTYRRYVTSALAELTSILWFNELGARMRRESDQATSGGGGDKLGSA